MTKKLSWGTSILTLVMLILTAYNLFRFNSGHPEVYSLTYRDRFALLGLLLLMSSAIDMLVSIYALVRHRNQLTAISFIISVVLMILTAYLITRPLGA